MASVLSLYTGAGGLDFGLEAAGFNIQGAIEQDAICCETIRVNRQWPTLEKAISPSDAESIAAFSNIQCRELDLLSGGPPCQPFSKSAFWHAGETARLADPRAGTLATFLEVLKVTQPRAFLLENVPGIAFHGKSEGLEFLNAELNRINKATNTKYKPTIVRLNASDYGVPQTRHRIFVIGSRDGVDFRIPPPTHSAPNEEAVTSGQASPWMTAWDAIGDLEHEYSDELKVTGSWAALLPTIPEGKNYLFHTDRGAGEAIFPWRGRYWSFLLKLSKRKPSWTLQANPGPAIGPFHWNNRRLSVREMCRLQTIPDDFGVVGSYREAQRQIGNAVPSLLAEVLGRSIRQQFLDAGASPDIPSLLPARRSSIPPARPRTRKIPEKYLRLVGEHPPHPGTGKGPSALRRRPLSGQLTYIR